jgi:hypothetical protein
MVFVVPTLYSVCVVINSVHALNDCVHRHNSQVWQRTKALEQLVTARHQLFALLNAMEKGHASPLTCIWFLVPGSRRQR